MERPKWRPKRAQTSRQAASRSTDQRPRQGGVAQAAQQHLSARDRWPPPNTQVVDVSVVSAGGLPRADRSGHSDPYATCEIPGKPKSKVKTKVIEDTEAPVWNQELVVHGWRKGDPLVFSVWDFDLVGNDDMLSTVELASAEFFPSAFQGQLNMENTWNPEGQRVTAELKRRNTLSMPHIQVTVSVRPGLAGGQGQGQSDIPHAEHTRALAMPGVEPTLDAVCHHLDDFDANIKPVPRLGNFWMTPRGDGNGRAAISGSAGVEGNALAATSESGETAMGQQPVSMDSNV